MKFKVLVEMLGDLGMDEMKEFFKIRTDKHIKAVQENGRKIYESDTERFDGLPEQLEVHDASKYEEPEYTPYLYVTWDYKCKDEGVNFNLPADMKDKMSEATQHHVINNSHHPECHNPRETNLINRDDRDAPPDEIVDASKMPDVDIAELIADWTAMGKEKGNSAKDWADDNIGTRWSFTPEQTELIYKLIKLVEE